MNQTIEIIIAPSGQTRLETKGFAGAACQVASRRLEQALGPVLREQRTAEFHQVPARPAQISQGGAA